MARYRVPDQALRNFLSILAGFILGGVNNLLVLPWAFGDNLSEWGLVRVVAAWGTLIGPILAFGSTSAMNRYAGRMKDPADIPRLFGTLIWPLLTLFLLGVVMPALLFPEATADLLGLSGQERRAVKPMALLAGIQGGQVYFAGFLSYRLKTALSTFLRETLFKFGYLALALTLGMGWLAPEHFLPSFVGLYGLILLMLFAQAMANHFSLDLRGLKDGRKNKEVLLYGGTLILGNSAIFIMGQIDIIMIGRALSLEHIPAYTIAAFIAAVAQIPQRSVMRLLTPLIAQALHRNDLQEVWRITDLSHRALLLGGGWVLACVWVSTPQIDVFLPTEFRQLEVVILAIGAYKVVQGSTTGSQVLVGQSDHFRWVMLLNWLMVILAIPLNLWFIPDSGLGLGLVGAALATLVAIGISVLLRQWVVWHLWRVRIPGPRTFGILLVLLIPCLLLQDWDPGISSGLLLLVKSAITTLWTGLLMLVFRLVPEAITPLAKRWPALNRWK